MHVSWRPRVLPGQPSPHRWWQESGAGYWNLPSPKFGDRGRRPFCREGEIPEVEGGSLRLLHARCAPGHCGSSETLSLALLTWVWPGQAWFGWVFSTWHTACTQKVLVGNE